MGRSRGDELHRLVLKATAELYAYSEIVPPVLEYTEVFSPFTGESSDIVRKEMYTFLDKGERSRHFAPGIHRRRRSERREQ
jgi:histidyl-tRNA synthetase